MAKVKDAVKLFNVFHQEYFGGPKLQKGCNVSKERAEAYVKEMDPATPGAFTIEEA